MVSGMKIELSKKEEIVISLAIAAVLGGVWGSLISFGSSYRPELVVLRNDLTIEKGLVVSAQSLEEGTSASYVFPPPLYVFEWVEFKVDMYNASGGVIEINFTRDDEILRTDLVYGSPKIVLTGYGTYRLRESNLDVTLQALNEDVRLESIYITINRGTKQYNPLFSALNYLLLVVIVIIIPRIYRQRKNAKEVSQE